MGNLKLFHQHHVQEMQFIFLIQVEIFPPHLSNAVCQTATSLPSAYGLISIALMLSMFNINQVHNVVKCSVEEKCSCMIPLYNFFMEETMQKVSEIVP
jgi:hypothetical protein